MKTGGYLAEERPYSIVTDNCYVSDGDCLVDEVKYKNTPRRRREKGKDIFLRGHFHRVKNIQTEVDI